MDINIFLEIRLYYLDSNVSYVISGYIIFWNDSEFVIFIIRFFGGIVVYIKIFFKFGYLLVKNINGVEIIIIKVVVIFYVNIIGVYRLLKVLVW